MSFWSGIVDFFLNLFRPSPTAPQLLFQTQRWDVWAPPQLPASSQAQIKAFVDNLEQQLASDLGIPGPARMVLYIQQENSGTFGTPTPEGPGVFMGYNIATSSDPFWFYIATIHESVNTFTGTVATDWVFADGSPVWQGSSPFPNMCDIVISQELGLSSVSDTQASRELSDPRVKLFYDLRTKYSWSLFKQLFALVEEKGIKDWSVYSEPLRTGILIAMLSHLANTDLTSQFATATGYDATALAAAKLQGWEMFSL